MHHSSLQDWWHAGPSGLRRKRTQEGRVDIFWDALQRFFLDVGWLKMGTNGDPLERLELIRSLQNLFIILSLSATFSHFQPLSATFSHFQPLSATFSHFPPNQVSKIYRILRDRRFFEHVGCWSGLCITPRSDNRRVRKSIPRCLDSAWSGWLPCNFSTRVGCPVYRII